MGPLRRVTLLASATLITSVSLVGASASLASASLASAASSQVHPRTTFLAEDTGYGSTLAAAERQGRQELHGDFSGCGTAFLISDAGGDGSWSATMGAYCTGYN